MNVVSLKVARLSFLFSKTTPQLPAKKWIMVIKLGLLSYDFCFKQGQGLRDSAAHPIRGLSMADPGEGPDQTETQRAEKNFFGDRPPTLISGSGWPAPFPHPLYITGRIVTGSATGRWAYNWGGGGGGWGWGLTSYSNFPWAPQGVKLGFVKCI